MIAIDALALRNSLLSLSFISFAISAFSTSFNTMSSVEAKLQKRIETTEKGIPYIRSKEYNTLKNTNLLKIAKWIRRINTGIAIILFLSLITILVKPVDIDKYSFVMEINPISLNVVKENKPDNAQLILSLITTLHEEDLQKDAIPGDTSQDEVLCNTGSASIYFGVVAGLAIISSFLLFGLLLFILKLQKIQVDLLKLEKEQAFR